MGLDFMFLMFCFLYIPRTRGMDRPEITEALSDAGIPRACGDDSGLASSLLYSNGSPRTRGDGSHERFSYHTYTPFAQRRLGWFVIGLGAK